MGETRTLNSPVQTNRRVPLQVLLAASFVLLLFSFGCGSESKPLTETAPVASVSPTEAPAAVAAKSSPPEIKQVNEAVKRVFKDAAVVAINEKSAFVAGDFNGDQSEDLAVVLKPVPEKIAALNEEYPAWLLRDLVGHQEGSSPRLKVGADDVLLAIIHGYGAEGWRDPQATQTYLLKNAAGSAMEARAANTFISENKGKKLPTVRGDLISEMRGGKPGYLYYSLANYSWYDPKTFTGEPEPRPAHGAAK